MGKNICAGLNESALEIYHNNKEKGFWDNERNVGEMLMLIVSELGEAMEAHRKDKFSVYDSKLEITPEVFQKLYKDTFEDEIADAVIRILDMCGGLDIDLEWHIQQKVEFNKSRERLHGKQY